MLYNQLCNYFNNLMIMKMNNKSETWADNDEAPRVVESVVCVNVVTSLSGVVELPVATVVVVVISSGSHAKAIFVIASSNFCTPASFCFTKFSLERFFNVSTNSAGKF